MALHESVLEEFGLAPLWVRRGMAAQQAVDAADSGAVAPQAADAADAAGLARASAAQQRTQQAPEQAVPADAQSAHAYRPEPKAHATQQLQPASGQPPAQARTPASEPPPVLPRQAAASLQSAPLSRPPEPELPAFDAPPADDFAWFDDLPSDSSPQARTEKPALPAIQTLDWDALSERVAGCQLCRLCEKRTNTVFGVGDRGADWMLIGEAPGENEDRQGEPFVGQAGKLLDSMLRSLTLARDTNVYIANVIKCRPPGNRNPEPDEVARCEPYLQRQVSLVRPKLIVALGRFAAQSLLKTTASISSLRGRVHEYEGVPVVVTYHPAYLLRSLPDKAKAWADLCLARDTWRAAGAAAPNASE
ncbi:uracil-DNA glycosylase [Paraburkholderia metrosideri]|uniref:Type-4 uracil-DNA glycosylase n=1 Tax=Paraburkholderia metrosideri TaxID=580937 RepID=A0ABM8NP14_9BURK|nr:uracil-DNA glycosylase [Paraburkholderia metrosideri]CAD6535860.1 hypothetical protein LMG28140_02977 [Paraburkholderia metrosideri]